MYKRLIWCLFIMKNLLFIFCLSFLVLFSCSSKENNSNITFLEKYDGTVWVRSGMKDGENFTLYMRFINDELNPFEFWEFYNNDQCNYYDSHGIAGKMSLTLNSNDTLKFEYSNIINGAIKSLYKSTITSDSNNMFLNVEEYQDGVLVSTSEYVYDWSTMDVESFCS